MNGIAKPIDIVKLVVADLKSNDCPALQVHLDDLQESLVERVMAGDLEHQGMALNYLKEALSLEKDMGTDALRGLLNRVSITNQTAQHIISKYDCPLLNNAVCSNLIHFQPVRPPGCRVSSFGIALYWLSSGDHGIFDRFATHLLTQNPDDQDLQYEILEALNIPMRSGNQDSAEAFYNWVARNQDKIIAMNGDDYSNFSGREIETAIALAQGHIPKLGKLIAEHSRQSPKFGDLYLARTLLGVNLSDTRMAREWAGEGTGMGWAEVSVLQALMTYHLAFEDSPQPGPIGGQDLNKANALIHSLEFLAEQDVAALPDRISFLVDRIVDDTEDEVYKREIVELFGESSFHRQLLTSSKYREHSFGADLGL